MSGTTVVTTAEETPLPPDPAPVADAIVAQAEAAVEIAEIEADRDVQIATRQADVQETAIAASQEQENAAWQKKFELLEQTQQETATQLSLIQQTLDRLLNPPVEVVAESEVTQAAPEAPAQEPAKPKLEFRHRWI